MTVSLQRLDNELEELNKKKTELQHKLESVRQEYISKGGDIVTQRHELFQKRTDISSRMENGREQLVLDAASELPLVLVKDLLRNIREKAEIEQDNRMLTVALQKMEQYSSEYETENGEDKEAIIRFIEYV